MVIDLHPAVQSAWHASLPIRERPQPRRRARVVCRPCGESGKTTTLVARVCWLVACGADPASITAVTFNKRAAEELGERLALALEPLAPAVVPRVRTFHALGREILAGAGAPVKNLTDRADVLRALNRGRGLPAAEMRRLDDGFSRLKLDEGLDAAASERLLGAPEPLADADLLHRFIAYERWLAERSALDFDDLVRRALALLREDAAALAGWRLSAARRCSSMRSRTSTDRSSTSRCCSPGSGATSSWSVTTIKPFMPGGWPTCGVCSIWPASCPDCGGSTS